LFGTGGFLKEERRTENSRLVNVYKICYTYVRNLYSQKGKSMAHHVFRPLEVTEPVGEQNAAEIIAKLREENELLIAAVEALLSIPNESICAIDQNGVLTMWNEQMEQRYKIKASEALGRYITDFFSNLIITKVQDNALSSGKPIRDRYHQPVLGQHVLINAAPIMSGDRVLGALTSEREITETMRLSNELARSHTQVNNLKKEIDKFNRPTDAFDLIYGRSPALTTVVEMAKRVANTNVSILLRGESGTGKELFAEAIHKSGSRHDKPFVVLNCGAIPANLFESELFGYAPGAFTGADKRGHRGKFEEANHGTLFLDEIGELPLDMQVKLLRVLQNQRFYRVGGGDPIEVDVRLLSATNRDLARMIEEGRFRDDLYYRINVVALEIPPLRERKEDISQLIYLFLREFCLKQGIAVKHIDPEVIIYMMNYSWPGNIRELRNVVERLVVLSDSGGIHVDDLPGLIKYGESGGDEVFPGLLADIKDRAERDMIIQALEKTHGDRSRAARLLGVPRSTLYYKLHKYQIGGKAGHRSK